ncbi:1-phosphofructokinase family hexose kinase [Paenibacillus spongiae]|uniref:Tagatose-6-phosphate kinase n=1 Tax=Paenibacillus spongiae TaxID=2909671 RepID=A0ABY5SA07_9BACL|nr:1-phosphofructokinase family hexose kinase [Paenibacillus spongiae]UVI30759.1 1-phosphofructokinase family hexose kinase [Paenibacillus spongiae]
MPLTRHITTVTLNAAIDKTYFVPDLVPGKANRASRTIAQAGGKGINAARVAHALGEPVIATGFAAGLNGQMIRSGLTQEGIPHSFVEAAGESRTCLNLLNEATGESLEILEAGIQIGEDDCERLFTHVKELAATSSVIVMSGSIPSGGSPDIYRRLIEAVKEFRVPVILDTSGEALLSGIQAAPFMIKPNKEEAARLTSEAAKDDAEGDERLHETIRYLAQANQIPCIAVSLGEKGAVALYQGKLYSVSAAKVQAVNPVGSGDAFVAGFAVSLHRGYDIASSLMLASACGASNSLHSAAGIVLPDEVAALIEQIEVRELADL